MDTKQPKVIAEIRCPCIACLGSGYDVAGNVCAGCKGHEKFFLDVEEDNLEDVLAWDDGPAWDAVYEKIAAAGADSDELAWKYAIDGYWTDGAGHVHLSMKIIPYPVSKETADAMNATVRK